MEQIPILKEGRILDGRFNEGLLEENWYHGEISSAEAEARLDLEYHQVGSFLVRKVGKFYILSFLGKFQGKICIKHLKVPTSRHHTLLKENPGLKTEYDVIKFILSIDCKYKYFLHPVDRPKNIQPTDLKNIKITKKETIEPLKSLKCILCENIAKSRNDAIYHDITHKLSFCERCKGFVLLSNQLHHKRKCDPNFILKCELCSKYETKCPSNMRAHKKASHSEPNIKCPLCDKGFRRERKLQIHEIEVHKKPVSCDLCGMTFANTYGLPMHKKMVHNLDTMKSQNMNKYQCPKCDFKAPWLKMINKHLNTHDKPFKYQCNDCAFFTNKKKEFEKHNACFHKYLMQVKKKEKQNIVIVGI